MSNEHHEYVMQVRGTADELYHAPLYLEAFDVDGHDGRGDIRLTPHASNALRFPSCAALLDAWKTTARVRPTRKDGQPNRPLTAYTISPELVPALIHFGLYYPDCTNEPGDRWRVTSTPADVTCPTCRLLAGTERRQGKT